MLKLKAWSLTLIYCTGILVKAQTSPVELANQVPGVRAEQSKTKNGDEDLYAAAFAVDDDLVSKSWAVPNKDGVAWMRLSFDKVHCVERIVRYWKSGKTANEWTCSETGCDTCEGHSQSCNQVDLTFSITGPDSEVSNYLPGSKPCIHGNSIMFETRSAFGVHHVAIVGEEAVRQSLSFVEVPMNVSTVAGKSVTLACKFNMKPDSIEWQYRTMDGNPGAMSEMEKLKSGKWVQQETGNLVIPEADRHDSGKYTCSGSAFDDHLSAQSQVTVNYFDPSGATGPESTRVIVGDPVTLVCGVPDSHPPAQIAMFKDGEEGEVQRIESSVGYKLRLDDSRLELVIENAAFEDAADYYCISSNKEVEGKLDTWTHDSSVAELYVTGTKPSVHPVYTFPGDLGSTAVVALFVIAEPAPQAEWHQSAEDGDFGLLNNETGRVQTTVEQIGNGYNYSLALHDLRVADHGAEFRLKLSNKLGSVTSNTSTILVNHLICRDDKSSQEMTRDVQEAIQLDCPMSESAYPEESYRWIYDESTSSFREDGMTLVTDSLTKEDEGEYICETQNTANTCRYVFKIMVQDEEEAPEPQTFPEEEIAPEEETTPESEETDTEEDATLESSIDNISVTEKPKKPKNKKCPKTYKKMSRRCLEEQWTDRTCAGENGATNIDMYSCGKWTKRCDKEGKNKTCCKAIYCWGRKLSDDFAGIEAGPKEEKDKPKKKECSKSHKKMSRKCLEAAWVERECAGEDGATSIGNNSCINYSRRCDKDQKNKACCRSIYCWGQKLSDEFPDS